MVGRRILRVTSVVAAVVVAYAAGVATGRSTAPHKSVTSRSVLDEAEDRISSTSAHPISRDELERAAVQGMLGALDDRWSSYWEPSDFSRFQQVLEGHYTGVGVWVRRGTDGTLRVASVQQGSPADRAGVRVADELVTVDGRSVRGRSVVDVVAELRGAAGTVVAVGLQRGGRDFAVRLVRVALSDDDVAVSRLSDTVVRLRVAAFTRGVGRWVRDEVAAEQRRHIGGLVLDLRDNPGGLLDEAVETASAFLDGGPVVSYSRRGSPPRVLDALGNGDTATPLVVLVDGGTASAAEVVAAALQDRGRAVIIGSRTFGKGSVQEPSQLSDGSALELTVGRYYTPNGHSLDGVGITPDVQVRADAPPGAAEQRAVEVLSGLLADTGTAGRG
jgi:carboxyl-terminal processing protease